MHAPLPWFRLYHEFASDPKVQMLEFSDQRHFIIILCLKANGTLDAEYPTQEYRHRAIGRALGLTWAEATEVLQRLTAAHLVDKYWQPRKWQERQARSDSSAERTQRYRERKKRHGDGLGDGLGDVTVTEERRGEEKRSEKNNLNNTFTADEIAENKARLFALTRQISNEKRIAK